jgi:endogenous inhibitor of DNA gyrase (YacG/DUF329 family)
MCQEILEVYPHSASRAIRLNLQCRLEYPLIPLLVNSQRGPSLLGAPADTAEFLPFCSAGCKDRDLLQWLGDGYKIPGPAVSPDQLAEHFASDSGRDSED